MTTRTRTVGILLFDEVEVLDAFGPFEVFSVARTALSDNDETNLFRVITIAETTEPVHARGGLVVMPHHSLEDHPPLDILLLPGGFGTRTAVHNPAIMDWVRKQASQCALRTSVCTGAFLYADIGLLDGKSATTHWGSIDRLREGYPDFDVLEDVRFVDQDTIITSAGISAGIDMALHVVARLHGQESAALTARHMEYDWHSSANLA